MNMSKKNVQRKIFVKIKRFVRIKNICPHKKIFVQIAKYISKSQFSYRYLKELADNWQTGSAPNGPMVQCYNATMVSHATMVSNGPMLQWSNGPMVQWSNGPTVQWSNATMVQCYNGPMHYAAIH